MLLWQYVCKFRFALRTEYREIKVELSAVYLYFIGFWACVNLHVFNFTFSLTNPISCYCMCVCVLMMLVLLSQRYQCTVCFHWWTMNDSHFTRLTIAFRNDKIIFVEMRDLIRCNTANIRYIIGFLIWLFLILIEHVFFFVSPSFCFDPCNRYSYWHTARIMDCICEHWQRAPNCTVWKDTNQR